MDIPKKTQLQLQMCDFKVQSKLMSLYPEVVGSKSNWELICKHLNLDPIEYKGGVIIATIGVKKL